MILEMNLENPNEIWYRINKEFFKQRLKDKYIPEIELRLF
jgi:hypothetical protein